MTRTKRDIIIIVIWYKDISVTLGYGISSQITAEFDTGIHQGLFDINMGLWTNQSFKTQVSSNFAVRVPDMLYVGLSLEDGPDELILQGRKCWATPR